MAGRGVARARVELLLAVSMVTGSHGACLVQPVSVSWGGGVAAGEFLVTGYVEEMFPHVLVMFESGTPSESPLQSARSHRVAPMQRAPG